MDWFSILVSILYTIILYGVGPLLFALLRKKPVTKGQVKGFSILYSFSAWFCSNLFWALCAGDPVSSGGAALLWGWIFYKLLKNHLDKTSRLTSSTSAIPDSRYKAQEKKMGEFVVDTETGEVIRERPPEPKPSNTNIAEEPTVCAEPVQTEELPVVHPAPRVELTAPKGRKYKADVIVLSAVCVLLAGSVIFLGYSASSAREECLSLETTVSELRSQNEKDQEKIAALVKERNSISEELDQANDQLEEMMEPYQFLSNNIGFIVSGSNYYHTCDCSVYQKARSFQAHNVHYCRSLGYSSCPVCWNGKSIGLVDSKTGDPIVPKNNFGH